MAIPILHFWKKYYAKPDEGLGSSYERIIINDKLFQICKLFRIESVLEVPSFGFTGLSGINSLGLAKEGYKTIVFDHHQVRTDMIKQAWEKLHIQGKIEYVSDLEYLPLEDKSVDLSWNFSALWFVQNLENFLAELDRVTKKVILIMIPNRAGIGYLTQKYSGKNDLKKLLKEENIIPSNIERNMTDLGWNKIEHRFIDCPPWPDIGMAKEDFLSKLGLGFLVQEQAKEKEQITILDYYNDSNPDFANEMKSYAWLEKKAPVFFKKFWAHHQYMLFVRD